VIPTLFLFAILVLLPQAPLRIGQVKGIVSAPVPTFAKSGIWGGALVLFVVLLAAGMADSNLLLVGTAATYGIVMLSLVLLTGYGGFVSLAQVTFAGVGAVAYAKLDQPNLFGLLVAALIAAAVGAMVAIPVLRLTGLYLALATLAFAQLMDKLIFQASFAFEIGNPLHARRASILGLDFNGTGAYTVLMTVFFVAIAFAVIAVRRGRLGRILVAMRDSQTASSTLGLDLRWMRVGLFAASAGIAGLGGALFAGLRGTIVADDFMYFQSLLVLLVAVVWGVTSVTGVAVGGVFLMYLRYEASPALAGVLFVILGVGAVIIGRDPNGLANKGFGFNAWVMNRLYPMLADRYPGMALRGRGDRDDEPVGEADAQHEERPAEGPAEEVGADVVAAR
jgi:branched-chain amino acid transport system permease protein